MSEPYEWHLVSKDGARMHHLFRAELPDANGYLVRLDSYRLERGTGTLASTSIAFVPLTPLREDRYGE